MSEIWIARQLATIYLVVFWMIAQQHSPAQTTSCLARVNKGRRTGHVYFFLIFSKGFPLGNDPLNNGGGPWHTVMGGALV